MKSYKLITAIAVIISIACIMINRSPQTEPNRVVVGMMSGWAPFMSLNTSSGEYEGFDVDVACAIAGKMGKELVIKDLGSLASCFIALEQGRIDMVMSGLDITEKRQEVLNMVYYTGKDTTEFDLLFWQSIPASVKSIQDLQSINDAVVCAESGSAQEKFIDSFDFITKKRMSSVIDMVLDLQFGKSLAAVVEPRIAARIQKKNADLVRLPVPLPQGFKVFGCGIALKKENRQLTKDVQVVMDEILKDGTIKKLEQKWQLEE